MASLLEVSFNSNLKHPSYVSLGLGDGAITLWDAKKIIEAGVP
jgi:hypothetical protein